MSTDAALIFLGCFCTFCAFDAHCSHNIGWFYLLAFAAAGAFAIATL